MSATLVEADPLHAAWRAVGQPTPALKWRSGTQPCVRCREVTGRVARLVDVVSDKFTGWDDYPDADDNPVWCVACAWGHADTALRTVPWLVKPDVATRATPATLAAALAAPLRADVAVIVPVSRKKHLFPSAQWGRVTTDDRVLPWGARESARLHMVQRLRGLGFSEAALNEPAPRFEHLRTLPAGTQGDVLGWWGVLAGWRADSAYLAVAVRATRQEKR